MIAVYMGIQYVRYLLNNSFKLPNRASIFLSLGASCCMKQALLEQKIRFIALVFGLARESFLSRFLW